MEETAAAATTAATNHPRRHSDLMAPASFQLLPVLVGFIVGSAAGASKVFTGGGWKAYELGWVLKCSDGASLEALGWGLDGSGGPSADNPFYGDIDVTPGATCQVNLTCSSGNSRGSHWLGLGQAFTLTESNDGSFTFPAPTPSVVSSQAPSSSTVTSADEIRAALAAIALGDTLELFLPEGTSIHLNGSPIEVIGKRLRLVGQGSDGECSHILR